MAKKPSRPKSDLKAHTEALAPFMEVVKEKSLNPSQIQDMARTGAIEGRTKAVRYSDQDREAAYLDYLAGDSTSEIAARLGCNPRTVRKWVSAGAWDQDLRARRETTQGLEAQILRITRKKNPSNADAQKLAMLTRSLDRLRRAAPKPKPRPKVIDAVSKELLAKALDPTYGLYPYQVEFLQSEDRFRCVLKARQTGFSYVVGLAVLLGAASGRPQVVVSASETQAKIVLNYVRHHAGRLGVALEEDKSNAITVMGTNVQVVSTNFRTGQGFPGDVWFDEFAWVRNQDMLFAAIVPSITAIGGRVTIFSTPFMPGSKFWQIATNHQGKHDHWWRMTLTIRDAVDQGMPLPGGLDELRMLFDTESWNMFYECQWAEDGSALLSWALLHELTADHIPVANYGRLRGGVDVGRINDRTAIALVGQAFQASLKRKKGGTEQPGEWLDRFALVHHELHKGMAFDAQKATIHNVDQRYDIESWKIDKTGLGMQLSEELQVASPERFEGIWFNAARKQRLALNLLKLCEDRRLLLPNDPDVLAQLHAVKKISSGTAIKYDADRTNEGHGDLFWALAMAAEGRAKSPDQAGWGVKVLYS